MLTIHSQSYLNSSRYILYAHEIPLTNAVSSSIMCGQQHSKTGTLHSKCLATAPLMV